MIRRATPQDAESLGAILADWVDSTPWMRRVHPKGSELGFLQELIADTTVYCLEDLRGFLSLQGSFVRAFYLAPSARRQGYGATLLDRAKAERGHLSLWCFQANTDALRFYEKQGFQEVTRTDGTDNEEQLPDVGLRWERDENG